MIIGLSGYAKSGKDTVAEMIIELTRESVAGLMTESPWQIKKFSGKLKVIASLLTGIPVEKFEDQEFKDSILGLEWYIREETMPCGCDRFMDWYHKDGKCANCDEPTDVTYNAMRVREFLQRLGTDAVRNGLHTNAWVNALMADYRKEEKSERLSDYMRLVSPPSKWVITDVRFPNEAEAIKEKGGVIIRIDRPGIKPVNAHPSETALDNWDFDYKIANVSDLVSLKQTVEVLLKKII